jgi:drug/metabolite transporter (DMT)-like permease
MLRGTMVLFAGLWTMAILRRRLHGHHWFGMILIMAGAPLSWQSTSATTPLRLLLSACVHLVL